MYTIYNDMGTWVKMPSTGDTPTFHKYIYKKLYDIIYTRSPNKIIYFLSR